MVHSLAYITLARPIQSYLSPVSPPSGKSPDQISERDSAPEREEMDWQTGTNPNLPFEGSFARVFHDPLQPPQPPTRSTARKTPTAYFLEQANFYAENLGPDPFATEPEVVQPRPLKIAALCILKALQLIFLTAKHFCSSSLSPLLQLPLFVVQGGIIKPLNAVCKLIASIEWEVFVALAVASQITKYIPGVGSKVAEEIPVEEPVYKILIAQGRSIGTGAVYRANYGRY